jgi:hypothetical protein
MAFGGAPCPSFWWGRGVISESLADFANSLLHNPHWDHLILYDNTYTIDVTPDIEDNTQKMSRSIPVGKQYSRIYCTDR